MHPLSITILTIASLVAAIPIPITSDGINVHNVNAGVQESFMSKPGTKKIERRSQDSGIGMDAAFLETFSGVY